MADVRITPDTVHLTAGESIDVTVTVEGAVGETGKVYFPAKTLHGQVRGTLNVSMDGGAMFLNPDNPQKLPIQIEKLEETATTAKYRLTADTVQLSRAERRRLLKN
jgi:hypothetical protein